MKKICASIASTAMLFLFWTVPVIGMKPILEQPDVETLYKELASKPMPALRAELKKIKNDAVLLALIDYRKDQNVQNLIKVSNAASWELLARLCTKNNLRELFEGKKMLPQIPVQAQKSLRLNFLKFVGLYIAAPAPTEKQEKALLAIQAMPQASIAQFTFIGDKKLLILKNDYKTFELFNPNETPPAHLSSQEMAGSSKIIKVDVLEQQSHFIPLFVTLSLDPKKPSLQVPLSIDMDQVRVSGSRYPVEIDTNNMLSALLTLFHDMNTKQLSTDNLTISNLLFLTYLYHFPNEAIVNNSNILKESYLTYYNALPEAIRARLNLRPERYAFKEKEETEITRSAAKIDPDLIKKAAQQVWWKRYPAYIWNTIKSPFTFMWTRISSWWNK
jgi:hypothetical protein